MRRNFSCCSKSRLLADSFGFLLKHYLRRTNRRNIRFFLPGLSCSANVTEDSLFANFLMFFEVFYG